MLKGYWLHSNKIRKRPDLRPGIFILIYLAFVYFFIPSIHASAPISVDQIRAWEKKSQGDLQKRYRAWANLIQSLRNKPVNIQLEQVNSFFNQFSYESDLESRSVDDYWKTPVEFMEDGGGDCEDYAIIKYFTLITLGIPPERLRITYVTSLTLNQAHMVLSYYPSPEVEPLILDSLEANILKASQRPDLKPVYSFNTEGLWFAKLRGQGSLIGQPASLDKWGELIKRMQ